VEVSDPAYIHHVVGNTCSYNGRIQDPPQIVDTFAMQPIQRFMSSWAEVDAFFCI
jgi:hypothetical protein